MNARANGHFVFKVSNMFIVSLAVADLIVGLSVMPISTIYIFTGLWPFGVAVCQIWIAIDYIASTASILNLFILSLDRYWSVRAPLQYLHKRTRRRALSMISLVWVASSLWVIPIVGWHYFAHGGIRTVPDDVCDTEYARDSVFKVVTAFFNFYLPLSVMYGLYIRIFIEIRKRSEFELGQRNPGRRRLSYHVKANPIHSRSHDDDDVVSDGGEDDDDTFSDERTTRMTLQDVTGMTRLGGNGGGGGGGGGSGGSQKDSVGRSIRENGARPKQNSSGGVGRGGGGIGRKGGSYHAAKNGNLRLLTMRRQVAQKEPAPSSLSACSPLIRRQPYKVEYVYDENVLDPQTEKLERYYYEDNADRGRCLTLSSRSAAAAAAAAASSASDHRGRVHRNHHLLLHRTAGNGLLPRARFPDGEIVKCSRGRDDPVLCSGGGGGKMSGAFGGVFVNMHSLKRSRHGVSASNNSNSNNNNNNGSTGAGSNLNKPRSYGSTPRKSKQKASSASSSATSADPMRKMSISCEALPSLVGRDFRGKGGGAGGVSVGSAACGSATDPSCIEMTSRCEQSSSSSSAASTFEDGRLVVCNHSLSQDDPRGNHRCIRLQNHHVASPEGYSLVSGIRRMRLAETFVDHHTVIPVSGVKDRDVGVGGVGGGGGVAGGGGVGGAGGLGGGGVVVGDDSNGGSSNGGGGEGKQDIFVLRDDKDRRLTGVLNLRHRIIKNLRVSSSLTKEIKAARQLGVIMGAFTVCFLPYFILFLVVAFCDDCIQAGLLTAATWVGYLNSTLNPFLYPLCNAAFRRKFRSMLRFRSSSPSAGYNFYERNSMTRARYD